MRDLSAGYGDVRVVQGISFGLDEGEIVSLVGPNGAGKSTTLRVLSGLLRPSGGAARFMGRSLGEMRPHEIVRAGLIQVPEGRMVFPTMSVWEHLMLGSMGERARSVRASSLRRVYELFPVLGERLRQLGGTLSGGEQQMLAIARGLMALPRLLVLDEPSLGLSPAMAQTIFRTIREINAAGTTVLLVEQNVNESLAMADRAYVLENGRIAQHGTGESLLRDAHVRRAYLGL